GPVRPPDSFIAIVSNALCQAFGAPVAAIAALIQLLTLPDASPPANEKSSSLSLIHLTGLSLRYFRPLFAISFGYCTSLSLISIPPMTFLRSSFGFDAYSHPSLTLLNASLPAFLTPPTILPSVPSAYLGICFVIFADT